MITWTPDRIQAAQELTDEKSYSQIAEALGDRWNTVLSDEQVRSALRRHKRRGEYAQARMLPRIIPPPIERPFDGPLYVRSQHALIMTDLHVPYHNAGFLDRALHTGRMFNCEDVFILGDLFNNDSVSRHPRNTPMTSLRDDMEAAANVLLSIASVDNVKRIIINSGNHDEWLARSADAQFDLRSFIYGALGGRELDCELLVTERDYVYVNDDWVFGHLSSYSKRPGEAARKIAEKYNKNVAVGHDHIQGFTTTSDGKYLAASIGCMVQADQEGTSFWYKERRLNAFPETVNGFMVLDRGLPYLFNVNGLSALNGGLQWASFEQLLLGQ